MSLNDFAVLASLSGRTWLAVELAGGAAASGVLATLALRRRRAAPALRPLPKEWDRTVVIAASQARDLVKETGDHTP